MFHYDIGYGCGTTIGRIKYTFLLVARGRCIILEYILHSLAKDEILLALHHFVRGIGGHKTHCLVADQDFKLAIGEIAANLGTTIN